MDESIPTILILRLIHLDLQAGCVLKQTNKTRLAKSFSQRLQLSCKIAANHTKDKSKNPQKLANPIANDASTITCVSRPRNPSHVSLNHTKKYPIPNLTSGRIPNGPSPPLQSCTASLTATQPAAVNPPPRGRPRTNV
jgi:hypothetical protein